MAYRRTRKYSAARLAAMKAGKARARMERPAPDYPEPLPELRMRITVERFDCGAPSVHVFALKRSRRIKNGFNWSCARADCSGIKGSISWSRSKSMENVFF